MYQEFTRIGKAIESGHFYTNPALQNAIHRARDHDHTLHILGLLSDGGVHSHEDHIHAMLDMAAREGLKKVCLHVFLDGRDTRPKARRFTCVAWNKRFGKPGSDILLR